MREALLTHFRILDLTDLSQQYCGKMLADLGADVTLIEPPGGCASRGVPPFKLDQPHPEGSLFFAYYNAAKTSLTVDLQTPTGRQILLELAASADALIECAGLEALGLSYEVLAETNPRLVVTSIEAERASLIAFARSGLMRNIGDQDGPPVAPPAEVPCNLAAVDAAGGTLAALVARSHTGRGQHVQVVEREVFASQLVPHSPEDTVRHRSGNMHPELTPSGVYACRDGEVELTIVMPAQWARLRDWLEAPPELQGPEWEDAAHRRQHSGRIIAWLRAALGNRSQTETVAEAQSRQIPCLPVNTVASFVDDPHVRDRGFFQPARHPYLGVYNVARSPYRIQQTMPPRRRRHPHLASPASGRGTIFRSPLEGIRVVAFSTAYAGPTLSRYLADYGAEVIKIESRRRPDNIRYAGRPVPEPGGSVTSVPFGHFNRNKLGMSVDLSREEGRDLVRRLLAKTDVVVENFSGRVMRNWGFDYESLVDSRPDLIMLDMQGMGSAGPNRDYVTYGPGLHSYCGLTSLWGFSHPAFVDFVAAQQGVVAILAALLNRATTGRGAHIELAQYEAAAALLGVAYLDYAVNGRSLVDLGNRSLAMAPHGVYRCAGEDEWCAVAVPSDADWRQLQQALGWPEDPSLATAALRLQQRESLDARLESWTRRRGAAEAERHLQAAGVPAAAVQGPGDILLDPELRRRGFYASVEHPVLGDQELAAPTVRFSGTPARVTRAAPLMGQHNHYVLGDVLGLTSQEFGRLTEAGILD